MPRRLLAAALLLGAVPALAAENSPAPMSSPVKEAMLETKPGPTSARKPAERKAGAAPKGPRGTSQSPLPLLKEKNLGLGCAQG